MQEKRKYEVVAGQWKSSDDLISLYSDLLSSYPGLIGYVDPLHHQVADAVFLSVQCNRLMEVIAEAV